MQAPRGAQPSCTNRPSSSSPTLRSRGRATFCPRTRCAVRPPGHRAEPAPSQPNAPRWSATMAGEVHPVPFRTRKLSPLAPMVLRSSPWESRTSLTNEGHLLFSGPAGSNRRARFSFWRGPFVCPGAATPSRFHRCRFPWSTRPRLPPAADASRRRPCHLRAFPPGGRHVCLGYSLRPCLPGWFRAVWPLKGTAPYKTNKFASPSGSMVRRFCYLVYATFR